MYWLVDKETIYVSPEGTILSPGYPNPYTITHDFIWIVQTQRSNPQQTLTVLFDDFSVGKQDIYGRCISDYLEVNSLVSDFLSLDQTLLDPPESGTVSLNILA